jgi:hypothetical protein
MSSPVLGRGGLEAPHSQSPVTLGRLLPSATNTGPPLSKAWGDLGRRTYSGALTRDPLSLERPPNEADFRCPASSATAYHSIFPSLFPTLRAHRMYVVIEVLCPEAEAQPPRRRVE